MKSLQAALLLSISGVLPAPVWSQNQITGGNCSAAMLTGTYSLTFSGRAISAAGIFAGSFQGVGSATFDGLGAVSFSGIDNTNAAAGQAFMYSGTYTVPTNCFGSITMQTGSAATLSLLVWEGGKDFNVVGSDATYVYSGGGGPVPAACATSTLSGEYTYDASGFTLSGGKQNGAANESGVLNFDGVGNVTASYTMSSGTGSAPLTATGTYTVTSGCQAKATLTDSSGAGNSLNFSIMNTYGQGAYMLEANSQFVRSGTAHAAFLNPSQSIGNVASYSVGATPAGSVFVLFGINLATRTSQAASVPLPGTLLTTSVTVNGEAAPLFFVDTTQIDAQMPWDIPGGAVAAAVVKNGNSTSNAVAVFVPATGTPGISVYGNNRAVVVNQNGSVNSGSAPANAGDEVVAYFTGGGPVDASGKLTTGAPSPAGLSPVSGTNGVTVGTLPAKVAYMGLTPGSIGLYQANFIVPETGKGTFPVVITIAGQASNSPVMTVAK